MTKRPVIRKIYKTHLPLTIQQIKVLKLICKELLPNEIARRLNISEKTYFNHRENIIIKTKAKSNIGLYKYALKNGFVKLKMLK